MQNARRRCARVYFRSAQRRNGRRRQGGTGSAVEQWRRRPCRRFQRSARRRSEAPRPALIVPRAVRRPDPSGRARGFAERGAVRPLRRERSDRSRGQRAALRRADPPLRRLRCGGSRWVERGPRPALYAGRDSSRQRAARAPSLRGTSACAGGATLHRTGAQRKEEAGCVTAPLARSVPLIIARCCSRTSARRRFN